MMLGQKQIQVIFLFGFKMGHTAAKTTRNIHKAFGPELLMKVQFSGTLRTFAKEMKALKMRSALAGHRKVTATNWEDHWIWSPYNYTRSCRRTHCWLFYGCSAFKTNWKGEKPQYVGASCCCSVAKLCLIFLWPHGLQHSRLPCPSPPPGEFAQTHIQWVIQPSHYLSSPSPPVFNLCWLKIKKFVLLKCYLFLSYAKAMNHFLIRL